jgi:hypothetical protein
MITLETYIQNKNNTYYCATILWVEKFVMDYIRIRHDDNKWFGEDLKNKRSKPFDVLFATEREAHEERIRLLRMEAETIEKEL